MTKPKLTDALKPNAAQSSEQLPAAAVAAADVAASGDSAGTQPAQGDKGTQADASSDSASGGRQSPDATSGGQTTGAATQNTGASSSDSQNPDLAAYTAAFGETQGCVYFAKGVGMLEAYQQDRVLLTAQITDLKAENEKLKATSSTLAKEVLGNSEPLKTGAETAQAATGHVSKIDAYAQVLEQKMQGKP